LKVLFSIIVFVNSVAFGQHYFNKSYSLGMQEVYRGLVFNAEESTFWGMGTVNSSKFPHLYKFDSFGNAMDTVVVKNSSISNRYVAGSNKTIYKDFEGNLLVLGQMQFTDSPQTFAIIFKLTPEGDTIWTKEYPEVELNQAFLSGTIAPDGNYMFAGFSDNEVTGIDFWLVKLDQDGNTLWEKEYAIYGTQAAFAVDTTADGGFILSGYSTAHGLGLNEGFILKTDSAGNEIWRKWYGGKGNDNLRLASLPNGNTLVMGYFEIFEPIYEIVSDSKGTAMELDPEGNQIWVRSFSEYSDAEFDPTTYLYYSASSWFSGGTYVEDGYLFYGGGYDTLIRNISGWLVKTDFQGNKLWSRRYSLLQKNGITLSSGHESFAQRRSRIYWVCWR
jgi:hypothetical protein